MGKKMKLLIISIILFFLNSCANKQGISLKYYDECYPEYDYYGKYKKVCPHNIINYKTKQNSEMKGNCLQCN